MPPQMLSADQRKGGQVHEQMRQDHLTTAYRLGQQQLHGSPVDLAGNRSRGTPDSPDTENDQHHGLHEPIDIMSWVYSMRISLPPMSACSVLPDPSKMVSRISCQASLSWLW